jgi:hypothetical protein
MAMTTAERVRAVRERRRRREIQLTVVLHQRTWGRSPAAATRRGLDRPETPGGGREHLHFRHALGMIVSYNVTATATAQRAAP